MREYINKAIANPNVLDDPRQEEILRVNLNALTVPQLRAVSQELVNLTPLPNATKEQLVGLIIDTIKTFGGRVPPIPGGPTPAPTPAPVPAPTGGPTDLLDRLIANPQLVTTPHMTGDIYDAILDLTLGETRDYFRSRRIPIDIAETATTQDIGQSFIDYIRKLATGAITRAPTVLPPLTVPPIPQETQDVIDTLIQNPQRIDQADVRYLLKNRLRQLSPEQLRSILQEKFATTVPINVTKEQLISSIIRNIQLKVVTLPPTQRPIPVALRHQQFLPFRYT